MKKYVGKRSQLIKQISVGFVDFDDFRKTSQ